MKQAKQQGKNQCFLQVSNMHTYTLQLTQNILSSDQSLSQKRCIGFVKIWFRCQIFQNKKSKPKKVILAKVDFIKHFTRKIVPPYGEQLYSGFVQNLKLRWMKFWKLLNKILIFDTSRLRPPAPSLQIKEGMGIKIAEHRAQQVIAPVLSNLKGGCGRAEAWSDKNQNLS